MAAEVAVAAVAAVAAVVAVAAVAAVAVAKKVEQFHLEHHTGFLDLQHDHQDVLYEP